MTPPLIPAILALVNLDKPISLPPIGTYLSPVWERVKGLFTDKPVTPLPRNDAYQVYIDHLLNRPKPPLTPQSSIPVSGLVDHAVMSGVATPWAAGCVAVTGGPVFMRGGGQIASTGNQRPIIKRKRPTLNPVP